MYNLLILAQEGAEHVEEEKSGLDLILPAVDELVWGLICFLVVAFFLMKIAFPKLKEGVQKREQAIQQANEAAESSKQEAEKTLSDYKQQLAEARTEANKVIDEARQSAEQVRQDLIKKAEADAKAVVDKAQEQIEAERSRTLDSLRGEVGKLAVDLAEKVVGRSLDRSTQSQLVDDYIKEVGSMSGNGSSRGGASN
jgi:F-type H+-transporting ATPase subunit b